MPSAEVQGFSVLALRRVAVQLCDFPFVVAVPSIRLPATFPVYSVFPILKVI
jgi:hypothetical protein